MENRSGICFKIVQEKKVKGITSCGTVSKEIVLKKEWPRQLDTGADLRSAQWLKLEQFNNKITNSSTGL